MLDKFDGFHNGFIEGEQRPSSKPNSVVYSKAVDDVIQWLEEAAGASIRLARQDGVSIPVCVASFAKSRWYKSAASELRAVFLKQTDNG